MALLYHEFILAHVKLCHPVAYLLYLIKKSMPLLAELAIVVQDI